MTKAGFVAAWPRALFGLLLCAALIATFPLMRTSWLYSGSPGEDLVRSRPGPSLEGPAPAPPFYLHASSPAQWNRAVRCLTDAIYYEAAQEPEEGQRAVAQVIVNRVRDPHFPNSVCGVVYEGWRRRTGCQFSFACDGSIRRRHEAQQTWDGLRPLAIQALSGYVVPQVGTATHYYADYVKPNWLASVAVVAQIGKHVFCSWRGRAGQVGALTASYDGDEFSVSEAALDGDPPRVAHAVVHLTRKGRMPRLRVALARRGGWSA